MACAGSARASGTRGTVHHVQSGRKSTECEHGQQEPGQLETGQQELGRLEVLVSAETEQSKQAAKLGQKEHQQLNFSMQAIAYGGPHSEGWYIGRADEDQNHHRWAC